MIRQFVSIADILDVHKIMPEMDAIYVVRMSVAMNLNGSKLTSH